MILAGRVTAQTFTTLYNFPGSYLGNRPSGLILSGDTLYGTTFFGGSSIGPGTVFAVNTDGTGFSTLYDFTDFLDGAQPAGGLTLSGNTLYGTVAGGGGKGEGAVFKINTDGTGRTTLYSFPALSNYTNRDGVYPIGGVILSGNTLYGTAFRGGISEDSGTVFAVNTDGTGFTNLHTFTGGSDGGDPIAGLVLSGTTLYGMAAGGGSSGSGNVFKINIDGTGFTTLYSFTATPPYPGPYVNGDGADPQFGLILSGTTLYGTAAGGGSSGWGTVFAVNTNGTGFTTLHSFTAPESHYSTNSDGANPLAGLILSGTTLYGTTVIGGTSGGGTVFSLSLGVVSAPQLTIAPSGANVILTWPTDTAAFTLQSTTDLVSPAVWSTVAPGPTVVNGQNAVTNPISGTNRFYRLSQ